MIKPLIAASAAVFAILYVFGEEDRRVESVARTSQPLVVDLIKATQLAPTAAKVDATETFADRMSEAEAVQKALEAGRMVRADKRGPVYQGAVLAAADVQTTEGATSAVVVDAQTSYRYVTGTRVNLRAGPGTSNAIVAQLGLGAEAEVLSDQNGWYEIRTSDGTVAGWIFGKFLGDQRPG